MKKTTMKRILSPKHDWLYLDRPSERVVRVSNGHWIIVLDSSEFYTCPEFTGFLPEMDNDDVNLTRAKGLCFTYGQRYDKDCPKFDNVIPKDVLEPITRSDDLKDTARNGEKHMYARKFNGGDVVTWLSETYLDIIADATGDAGKWSAKDENSPAVLSAGGDVLAVLMPIHVPS